MTSEMLNEFEYVQEDGEESKEVHGVPEKRELKTAIAETGTNVEEA